ncbi:YitT family protein [Peribacillus simplex]|uniref:YitT family protein n=1 Tax=Peribacillus simplex TaxID=1478 RepID=UPI0025599F74|nr:YitT family protein [Peribacillus simplex]
MYIIQKITAILIGSLLLGIGINGFLVPHHLLDGGIAGIALIIHYYFEFPTGLAMFLLSIPLCIFAWIHERTFFYNSILGLIAASVFIDWLAPLSKPIFSFYFSEYVNRRRNHASI